MLDFLSRPSLAFTTWNREQSILGYDPVTQLIPGLQERSLRNVWIVDYLKSYNRGMPSFTVTSNVRKWSARGYNPRFFGLALKELHSITLKLVTHTISQLGSFAAEKKEMRKNLD